MLELLLWPLVPFLPLLSKKVAPPRAAAWAACAAAGAGWLADGMLRRPAWGPWLATGVAGGLAAAYVLTYGRDVRSRHERGARTVKELEQEAARLAQQAAALRREVDKHEQEERRAFQVYTLAKTLTESVSWSGLVARFTQLMQKITGSSDFLLYLTSDSGELELQVQSGAWSKDALPQTPPAAHPQWVPFGRDTLLQVPLWQRAQKPGDGLNKDLLGLLWVRWGEETHPSAAEIEAIFENLLIGFQKAKLFARMEALSRTDGLTGVMRRQTFLDHMEQEWNRARIFRTPFSFMLADVDHFKSVNDRLGHPAGDAVLARLGELLRQGVYETDFVGRYGGEEFGVLFSRADPEGVRRKAEMLRTRVAAEPFTAGWEKIPVTISLGIAHFPRDGQTVAEVLEAADKALYAAKAGGRNRVVDYGEIR